MAENTTEKRKALLKRILLIIPAIFLVELILGGSGNIVSIAGMSIRKILFALTFACECLYIIIFARKIKIKKLDWFVFAFIVLNIIWMTIVPYLKGTSIWTAIDDGETVFFLALYFPTVFLIRQGELDWERIKRAFLFLTVVLALWHIVMYTLETIHPGIYVDYYNTFLPAITGGSFPGASPVLGFGFVRIITTTSIYLVVALFYTVGKKNKKIRHYIYIFILIVAVVTTMTRSLMISILLGFILFLIPIHKSMRNKTWFKKLALIVAAVAVGFIINVAYIVPMSNQYVENVYKKHDEMMENENIVISDSEQALLQGITGQQGNVIKRIGSATSEEEAGNTLRKDQTQALLRKWKESPLVGFGYGSYTEDCIRSPEYVYLYESTVPAMLMKLGVFGMVPWAVLIIAMIYFSFKYKYMNKKHHEFLIWLIASVAFALSIQTNPFLFTFCGFSIIMFLCLDIENQDEKARVEQ